MMLKNLLTLFQHNLKIIILLFFIVLLLSCSEKNRDIHNHPDLKTGKELFEYHCSECHKKTGIGNVIKGIPPVIYQEMMHSDIRKFIRGKTINGRKHEIPFKNMPKKEARKIARHVKKLSIEALKK